MASSSKVSALQGNMSKPKLEKYYHTLYERILSKDYGFAIFGEPCDAVTIVELEDHLSVGKKIMKGMSELYLKFTYANEMM